MLDGLLSNFIIIVAGMFAVGYCVGIGIIAYHLVKFGKKSQLRNIKPYEKVLLFLYRHWFILFIQLLVMAIMGILPIPLLYIVDPPMTFLLPVLGVYYAILVYSALYSITMYLLDVWIVTDHRVIDSEQQGFFQRTTAEISLAKIQDISSNVTGVIATFLDYGNLEVQSAAASEKFFFKQIPHPNAVRDTIMNAHNEFIKFHPDDVEVHEQ